MRWYRNRYRHNLYSFDEEDAKNLLCKFNQNKLMVTDIFSADRDLLEWTCINDFIASLCCYTHII
jgi:hypothetical protein